MPIPSRVKQQLVWSDDVGAVAARAFQEGAGAAHSANWYGVKLDVVGDELSGDEIALAFSNVRLDPHGRGKSTGARRLRFVKDLPPCGSCVRYLLLFPFNCGKLLWCLCATVCGE